MGGARQPDSAWRPLDFVADGSEFRAELEAPVGGWYVITLRVSATGGTTECECGPIGVGEVYVIAGQSYAANAHDSLLTIDDPEGRVVVYEAASGEWRVAHDPQPDGALPARRGLTGGVEGQEVSASRAGGRSSWSARAAAKLVPARRIFAGGSIWPAAMELLSRTLDVPVAMVNVAAGGTAIAEWLPGQANHDRLLAAASTAGEFRAVLWQQGESDVVAETPPPVYRARFQSIRESLARHVGRPVDWLVAKSTYHPTVYSKPEIETQLRDLVATLWHEPGVFPGPDTDHLGDFARSPRGSSQHFTRSGQVVAGAMWYAALLHHLQSGDAS